MEKRTIIAIILSVLVLIIYQWLFVKPKKPAKPDVKTTTESKVEKPEAEKFPKLAEKAEKVELPPDEMEAVEDVVGDDIEKKCRVETELFSIEFTNRGARVSSWKLKTYQDDEGKPLEIVSRKMAWKNLLPLSIFIKDNGELTEKINSALFLPNTYSLKLGEIYRKSILTFRYSDGKGLNLKKELTFFNDSYIVEVKVSSSSRELVRYAYILLGPDLGNQVRAPRRGFFAAPQAGVQSILSLNGKINRVKSLKGQEGEGSIKHKIYTGSIDIVGLEDNYFASLFLPSQPIDQGIIMQREVIVPQSREEEVVHQTLLCGIPLQAQEETVKLFVGPKDYKLLSAIDPKLEAVVNFGMFSFIAKPLLFALQAINKYIHNYGFSIIILTIIIKLLFHPLTRKSYRSMKKMQTLQPKMKAIRDRYKNAKKDPVLRQKMNQEIMDLYRKEGISPMGGCLPMLLQLPVLFAFYKILYVAIEIRHAPFIWWITDLSKKDPYYITPIIMGITMLIQQRSTPTVGDPAQARMFKLMPIFFTFIFLSFPSGLVLYWLVNNLITIGEQRLINIKAKNGSSGGKGKPKGKIKGKKRSK